MVCPCSGILHSAISEDASCSSYSYSSATSHRFLCVAQRSLFHFPRTLVHHSSNNLDKPRYRICGPLLMEIRECIGHTLIVHAAVALCSYTSRFWLIRVRIRFYVARVRV